MPRPQEVLDALERRIPGTIVQCAEGSPYKDEHGEEIPAYVVQFDNGVVGLVYQDELQRVAAN